MQVASQRTRAAIAEETAILQRLDPDSVAAVHLKAVLEERTRVYVGLKPVRPRLGGTAVLASILAAATSWMLTSWLRATDIADEFVYGVGVGFFGGMTAYVVLASTRHVLRYRRRVKAIRGTELPPLTSAQIPDSSDPTPKPAS